MDRRDFLSVVGTAPLLALTAPSPGVRQSHLVESGALGLPRIRERFPLVLPPTVSGADLTLTAAPTTVNLGSGTVEAWTLNGSLPGPTIRLRRGDTARILLRNELPEETILHWHGLTVPEAADGHPRLAIGPGETYQYEFTVQDRAGLYWYHSHAHRRTAAQTYQGIAGLLIVEDPSETDLELPSGKFDLPLLVQDKRLGDEGSLRYDPRMGPDMMMGYWGDTAFVNGVKDATVTVERTAYRLRLLNGSNARIFDVGLDTGAPLTLIGSDGGLLESATEWERVMMGTGERVDVLVDFSSYNVGDRVLLRSFPFEVPGMTGMGMGGRGRGRGGMSRMMAEMMGGVPQGAEMDLLEFVVGEGAEEAPRPLPTRLSSIPAFEGGPAVRRRTFRFTSRMMEHTINGLTFEPERVDVEVERGRPEIWTIVNDGEVPHPVHVHVGQFRVLSRTGGRGSLMPWEQGLKDTVLIFPEEQVELGVRFDDYEGLFLFHCHNLEHEDMGMMANFKVVPPS